MPAPLASNTLLRLSAAQSVIAINADGTGGVPGAGVAAKFVSDLGTGGTNATLVSGTAPTMSTFGGAPALNLAGNASLQVSTGLAAFKTLQDSLDWTVFVAGTYPSSAIGTFYNGIFGWIDTNLGGRWCFGAVPPATNYTLDGGGRAFGALVAGGQCADRPFATGEFFTAAFTSNNTTLPSGCQGHIYCNGVPRMGYNIAVNANDVSSTPIEAVGTKTFGYGSGLWLESWVINKCCNASEIWSIDAYVRSLYGRTHPMTAAPYHVLIDSDSIWGQHNEGELGYLLAQGLGISQDCVSNWSWGGKNINDLLNFAPADVDPAFAILPSKLKIVIGFEFANLLNIGASSLAADQATYLRARKAAALAAGATAKTVSATCLPVGTSFTPNDSIRQALNPLILANNQSGPFWDQVADQGANGTTMGNYANVTDTTLYSGGLHPTALGDSDLIGSFVSAVQRALSTFTLTPGYVLPSSTTTVSAAGTNTSWVSAPFTASAGTLDTQAVSDGTHASFRFVAPSSTGPVTVTDTTSNSTTPLYVVTFGSLTTALVSGGRYRIRFSSPGNIWTTGTVIAISGAGTINSKTFIDSATIDVDYTAPVVTGQAAVTATDPNSGFTAALTVYPTAANVVAAPALVTSNTIVYLE